MAEPWLFTCPECRRDMWSNFCAVCEPFGPQEGDGVEMARLREGIRDLMRTQDRIVTRRREMDRFEYSILMRSTTRQMRSAFRDLEYLEQGRRTGKLRNAG